MRTISSDVCETIVAWAQAIPAIRRSWLVEGEQINVAIEVEPVADSEETLVLWLANCERWQSQLQAQFSSPVSLEWFDLDGRTPSAHATTDAEVLIYERAEPSEQR